MAADDNVNNAEKEVICLFDSFKEIDEVLSLIETLPDIFKDQIASETALEKITCKFMHTK